MIKRILVGLSGTAYTSSAIRHAVDIGQQQDAELTGVTVVDTPRLLQVGPTPIGAGEKAHELREHRLQVAHEQVEQAIDEFETACGVADVRYEVHREEGNPLQLMTAAARYHDLMVFGLQSLFEYDLVDEPHDELERLVKSGCRPLLAVAKQYQPTKRVLIAYSGSMESANAMRRFVEMRAWPDVQTCIVTFVDSAGDGQRLLDDAAKFCRCHGIEPQLRLLSGSPIRQLLPEAADWGADLIVMGNSARSLFRQKMFGDTALHVIKHADRPLLLSQ